MNDIIWIKKTLWKLNKFLFVSIFIVAIITFIAPHVISKWTNGVVHIEYKICSMFAAYTLITLWNNVYSFFLNGVNAIKLHLYASTIAALFHIPFALFLVKKKNFGVEGIILSMSVSLSFFSIIGPMETYRLIKKWEKN